MASRYSEDVYESSEMDDDDIKVVPATNDLLEEERASKHDLFETKACLIYIDDKGEPKIDNSVLTEISRIDEKIIVVGECGLPRREKSYLAGEKNGFTLGNTVQSETKGIWVWCKNHPKNEDEVFVFNKTVGLDDPEKGDPDQDKNLRCLTRLISSTRISNVEGVVDYDTLDMLKCNASKTQINGADLAALITSYVKDLRGNSPIQCEDAYTQAAKRRNALVLNTLMKDFKKKMKEGDKMTKKQDLKELFLRFFDRTLAEEESFLYLLDEYMESAKEQMVSHYNLMKEKLKTRCREIAAEKLSKMYDAVFKKNKHIYSLSDGYDRYENDMDSLQEQFFQEMKEYDKDDLFEVFEELKQSKQDEKMEIDRAASEDKEQQQFRSVQDYFRKEMNATLQYTLERERQKMNTYIHDQLDLLRAQNKELSNLINNSNKKDSLCSIM